MRLLVSAAVAFAFVVQTPAFGQTALAEDVQLEHERLAFHQTAAELDELTRRYLVALATDAPEAKALGERLERLQFTMRTLLERERLQEISLAATARRVTVKVATTTAAVDRKRLQGELLLRQEQLRRFRIERQARLGIETEAERLRQDLVTEARRAAAQRANP